jgi:hypothetical protein
MLNSGTLSLKFLDECSWGQEFEEVTELKMPNLLKIWKLT